MRTSIFGRLVCDRSTTNRPAGSKSIWKAYVRSRFTFAAWICTLSWAPENESTLRMLTSLTGKRWDRWAARLDLNWSEPGSTRPESSAAIYFGQDNLSTDRVNGCALLHLRPIGHYRMCQQTLTEWY